MANERPEVEFAPNRSGPACRENFTATGRGCPSQLYGIPNPRRHAQTLRASLEQIATTATATQTAWPEELRANGFIFAAEAWPGFELAVESLERKRSGIELVTYAWIRRKRVNPKLPWSMFRVQDELFFGRLTRYAEEETRAGRPKGRAAPCESSGLSSGDRGTALGADDTPFPTTAEAIWWEVWRPRTGGELDALSEIAVSQHWERAETAVEFPDRTITAVLATTESLGGALGTRLPIAELRSPHLVETPAELPPQEQALLARDLVDRLRAPGPNAPAVCLLTPVSTVIRCLPAHLMMQTFSML